LETIPQDETKLLALAPEFTAPANLKDPAKIEAAKARGARITWPMLALNWKTARDRADLALGMTQESSRFTAGTERNWSVIS